MTLLPFSCWMLKVSETTRCPLMKTPNVPESTTFSETLAFSFFTLGALVPVWLPRAKPPKASTNRTIAVQRIPSSRFIRPRFTEPPFLLQLRALKLYYFNNLFGNRRDCPAASFDSQRSFQVSCPPILVQRSELLDRLQQRPFEFLTYGVLSAAPPKFVHWSVQKNS